MEIDIHSGERGSALPSDGDVGVKAIGSLAARMRRFQEDVGLAVLFVALFLAGRSFTGLVTPAALLLFTVAPVPLSLVFLRNGNRDGLLASALSMAAVVGVFPASQVSAELGWFLPLMICGAVYGLLVNARASLAQTLITGTLVLTGMVMALVYGSGLHQLAESLEPVEGAPAAVREAARAKLAPLVLALTPRAEGEAAHKMAADRETVEAAITFWLRFPLFVAAAAALMLFGAYLYMAQRVLSHVGVSTPVARFTEWTVPWEFSWWLIAAIVLFLVTLAADWEWGQCVTSNVALLVALPYAVTTFSITGYLLERRQVGPLFSLLLHTIVLLNLPYLTLFAMLDPWVDYRRLAAGQEEAEGAQDEDDEE